MREQYQGNVVFFYLQQYCYQQGKNQSRGKRSKSWRKGKERKGVFVVKRTKRPKTNSKKKREPDQSKTRKHASEENKKSTTTTTNTASFDQKNYCFCFCCFLLKFSLLFFLYINTYNPFKKSKIEREEKLFFIIGIVFPSTLNFSQKYINLFYQWLNRFYYYYQHIINEKKRN